MKRLIIGSIILIGAMTSCQKDVNSDTNSTTEIQQAAAQTQAVAVSRSSTTAGDSVYVIRTCERNETRTAIDFSSLPASASSYLTTNYAGYTAVKALNIQNSSAVSTGYVAIIQYNGSPVGIKFDASGNFVRVLEQREGRDLGGNGWHHGGCFDLRDGHHRDTIALSALPSAITTYMAANYPNDTLLKAFIKRDSSFVIISKNNGLYVTVFTSAGVFVSREQIQPHNGQIVAVAETALPASITAYLTTTYPGYVFDKAFSFSRNGVVQNYCVIIDANNTKYAILFEASGNFIKVKVIR
jgi:hypothetical protein